MAAGASVGKDLRAPSAATNIHTYCTTIQLSSADQFLSIFCYCYSSTMLLSTISSMGRLALCCARAARLGASQPAACSGVARASRVQRRRCAQFSARDAAGTRWRGIERRTLQETSQLRLPSWPPPWLPACTLRATTLTWSSLMRSSPRRCARRRRSLALRRAAQS